MTTLTLSSKNQVVIPTAVRAKLGIRSGDKLVVERITDTEVVLKKQPSFHDLIGVLGPSQGDPVERIRKVRQEWQ